MRILAISDLHDDEMALERLERKAEGYDAIFITGDITSHSAAYTESVLRAFPSAYIIPGNNEDRVPMDILSKAKNYLHGKKMTLGDGYEIAGFGFSNPTPFHTPNELDDETIYAELEKLKINTKTIVLTHTPPYGMFDEVKPGVHIGSKAVRLMIEEMEPFAVFCGHLHEKEGRGRMGHTNIVKLPALEKWRYCRCELHGDHVDAEFRSVVR